MLGRQESKGRLKVNGYNASRHHLRQFDPAGRLCQGAAAGAAKVLGHDHGVTKALAKASITMAKADLWRGSGTTIT